MVKQSLLRALLAAAMALLVPPLSAAEVPVPPLKARVTDLTSTLRDYQRAALEAKLAAFERRKGSQVAVLLVKTTGPETIEQYSMRVVEKWKLGRKRLDDGVLLLAAMDDKRVRIEVGYGLEGALPDVIAKRIIAEDIVPRFTQGDWHGGISAGVDRILRAIEGESLPPESQRQSAGNNFVSGVVWVLTSLAVGVLVILRLIICNVERGPSQVRGRSTRASRPRASDGSRGVLRSSADFGGSTAPTPGPVRSAGRGTTAEDVMASRAKVAGISSVVGGIVLWLATSSIGLGVAVGVIAFVLIFVALMSRPERGRGGGEIWGGGGGGSSDSGGFFGGGGLFGGGGASGDWGD